MPFESRVGDDHTCGACIKSPKRFDLARSCGYYQNGLKDLIRWFKYRKIPHLAKPLGALLNWGLFKYFKDQSIDLIIPVPLHPKRMRSRGFNQAYLLALAAVKDKLKQTHLLTRPNIAVKTLIRIRATPPQTGLKRELRQKNIRNAFAVTRSETIKAKSILLVDDVYTTGATVNECARMLKKAGADRVAVLSLARAV
jgi:ComF family protein